VETAELALDVASQGTEYLYENVLRTASLWGTEENLMFVIGATNAGEFTNIRNIAPNHFYLVPGVGAQGGSLAGISEKAMTNNCGLLVNASRAVIYGSSGDDFAEVAALTAKEYADEMKTYLPQRQ
jgi:orotidine-5'-phosphate decarboxylase